MTSADAGDAATTTDPRPRNRRGDGRRLRGDILAAAAQLLDETGDEQAVTLRAVARRVGIAAPSIYSHFPDRQAILLAIVRDAFAELAAQLTDAEAVAAADPVSRLRAICAAYLHFAAARPQRYRIMFGGLWSAADALQDAALTPADAAELGQEALRVLAGSLAACVEADRSTSTNPYADAVALWLGLHGLAHQRALATSFPWPADVTDRLIDPLARLRPVATKKRSR